jgi:hypothetical protein
VAIWRRPKLTARGDPAHDQVVAGIVARLLELPRRSVVLAEDETHLNLLPHVRASWRLGPGRGVAPMPGQVGEGAPWLGGRAVSGYCGCRATPRPGDSDRFAAAVLR